MNYIAPSNNTRTQATPSDLHDSRAETAASQQHIRNAMHRPKTKAHMQATTTTKTGEQRSKAANAILAQFAMLSLQSVHRIRTPSTAHKINL